MCGRSNKAIEDFTVRGEEEEIFHDGGRDAGKHLAEHWGVTCVQESGRGGGTGSLNDLFNQGGEGGEGGEDINKEEEGSRVGGRRERRIREEFREEP
mmetsp:Transcript_9322/g.18665  ORF Transcript_9322/g.18665 Transcript_9322/m.18665 type:complete len:97 (-) Transcript_9322:119-409(-)